MKLAALLLPTLIVSLVACAPHVKADIVGDVESQTVGAGPTSPWGNNPDAFVRDDTTATPFGTSNQYVEANSRLGGNGFRFLNFIDGTGFSPVERIQFQVVLPGGNVDDTAPEFRNLFRLAIRGDETTNNLKVLRTYNIDTVGGNLTVNGTNDPGNGTLAFDTVYNFDIIANISGSTFNSGGFDVADRTFDLFINNVQVEDNLALNQNTGSNTNINEIGFWQQTVGGGSTVATDQSTAYIDNVSFTSLTAAVPEPSSLALLGLIGMAGVVRRKRS